MIKNKIGTKGTLDKVLEVHSGYSLHPRLVYSYVRLLTASFFLVYRDHNVKAEI